jgi:hypothetical protein
MSPINGDKTRFNRKRKKIARRVRNGLQARLAAEVKPAIPVLQPKANEVSA